MKMVKNSVFQGGKLILGAKENFELSEFFFPPMEWASEAKVKVNSY